MPCRICHWSYLGLGFCLLLVFWCAPISLFLEEEMAIHSSILAWKILWTEEPGRLQAIRSQSWTQMSTSNCLFSIQIFGFLSRFSISSWFSLGRLYVSRNLSISSRLSNLLTYTCTSLLWFFCISVDSVVIFSLSLLMLITWALFVFSLVNLAIFFYQFCFSFQKTTPFHWSFLFF